MDTTITLSARPMVYKRATKRLADVSAAAILLLGIAPLWLLIAVLIRLESRGPVLFASERLGQFGRTFGSLRFRTMYVDAERRFYRLLAERPDLRDEYERSNELADDPRITRVGRWLRAASLDELPQLWNVLVGDMSMVGPRPYTVHELDGLGAKKHLILQVRPGIAGQVRITGHTDDAPSRGQHEDEVDYARTWSLRQDVASFFIIPFAVFTRRGR